MCYPINSNAMLYRDWAILAIILFIGISCSSSTAPDIDFSQGQFHKESVTDTTLTLTKHANNIWAGTTNGVFRKSANNTEWNDRGLKIDSASVIDLTFLENDEGLAVIKYDNFNPDNPMLFRSSDGGSSWAIDSSTAINEVKRFSISEIEKGLDSNHLYAYRGYVIKSTDAGNTWNVSFKEGSAPKFLTSSSYHHDQIWAGGVTNIFSPYLAKSEDGGESWTRLDESLVGDDATCYDALLHPDNPNHVLIGLGGPAKETSEILKSTDSGQSWETVLSGNIIRTFTHSTDNPKIVYASGRHADGTLFFAASQNFGDSWQTVEMPDSPAGVQVNDMVSVMEDGQEVLYLGTNNGVFSYRFEE